MISLSRLRAVAARRLILLGTAANLGIAAVAVGLVPSFVPTLSTADAAEGVQRATSFADLVERVKPAVISVRVNAAAGARTASADRSMPFPPNSEMERFLRRFGMPDMRTPETGPDNRRGAN